MLRACERQSTCLLNSGQFRRYIIEIIFRTVPRRVRNTTREYSHVQQDPATRSRSGANLIFRCNRTSWTPYISDLRARLRSHVVSNGMQPWHNWNLSTWDPPTASWSQDIALYCCPEGIDWAFLDRLKSEILLFLFIIIKWWYKSTIDIQFIKWALNYQWIKHNKMLLEGNYYTIYSVYRK